jgi:hypothetical protein
MIIQVSIPSQPRFLFKVIQVQKEKIILLLGFLQLKISSMAIQNQDSVYSPIPILAHNPLHHLLRKGLGPSFFANLGPPPQLLSKFVLAVQF